MRPAERSFFPMPFRPGTYRADQPVGELGFAEQVLVWAIRVQWTHIGDGRERSLVVQRTFEKVDMPEGAALIADLTEALMRASARPLAVPCPKWRVLTGDEARLLAFLAALQARDGTPLTECDPEWRAPRGSSSVWAPAQRLALAFTAASLHFGATRHDVTAFPTAASRPH